jgi:hypothetical protein
MKNLLLFKIQMAFAADLGGIAAKIPEFGGFFPPILQKSR